MSFFARRSRGRVAAAVLAAALLGPQTGARCEPGPAAAADAGETPGAEPRIEGRWTGSKLRCQKEEDRLVRCGTPSPFLITFQADGRGATEGGSLPQSFLWRRADGGRVLLEPAAGGQALELFGFESDGEMLTFQAYVFLPASDAELPPEARYIHYIFDVVPAP